ncbi:RNA polymerase sigma factor [Sandaracinomonas limnophila]|uniref:RNA polymerase sigma factor n=1 Tax=Sandaracinomonas limnophila TaxID=1862386 RepID=A0A437PUS8_9BACT|nr:RNA polymerase sigma factor [Sandaracinomonas limnophila]
MGCNLFSSNCILYLLFHQFLITLKFNYSQESDLLNACKKGDSKAQNELFKKYAGKMLSVCKRYVGEMMEAEEVLMEGFMIVFAKISDFKEAGSLEGWIRRIMVNESLMHIRKRKMIWVELEDKIEVSDPEAVLFELEAEEIFRMISNLPDGFRTVFNLYAIEGYSHQEIAEMLGISVGTSKSQLSRARVLLQKNILNYEK